jgi:RNA polymerase sigma factor (sigma-70 family)
VATVPVPVGDSDEPFDPSTWSWEQIVRAHRGDVYRHAYRLTRDPHDADRIIGREPTPVELLDDRTLDADVADAVRALPPHFRSAILLSDVHGLSYDQVATALGITLGTLRSRLHRGRAQLRAALAHRAPGPAVPTYAQEWAA